MTGPPETIDQRLSPCLEWIFAEADGIEGRVAAAADGGVRQVEFWYWRRRDIDLLEAALHHHRLGVSAVVVDPQANIADRRTHERWLVAVKESSEVAARLGSPILVVTAGLRLVPGPPDPEQLEVVTEALQAAAPIAENHGIKVALEPLNDKVDHPGTLLTSSLTALEIVERVGSPALGVLLDVYHSHAMSEDLAAVIAKLSSCIAHVQVADDPGRHEPGTGKVPWGEVLTSLETVGYSGSIGLEYKPTMPSAESVSFTAQVLCDPLVVPPS
jgi:hydroxypyruvate isomerase